MPRRGRLRRGEGAPGAEPTEHTALRGRRSSEGCGEGLHWRRSPGLLPARCGTKAIPQPLSAGAKTAAAQETWDARCWADFGRCSCNHHANGRPPRWTGFGHPASRSEAGAKHSASVGWRRTGRTLGGDRRSLTGWPHPAMERGSGRASLETKPSVWSLGLLWRAGADLLGLGSREHNLRLPLRGLARPDGRVGQSVGRQWPPHGAVASSR